MSTFSITVISSGLSEHSASSLLAHQLEDSVTQSLQKYGHHVKFEVFELKKLIPLIGNHLVMGFPQGELAQALGSLRESDAVITVTPVFKAGYAGIFKSFWDLVEDDTMRHKPVVLGATGGTARHSLALEFAVRPLFAYFQADIIPTAVFVATDDFGAQSAMEGRIRRAGEELAQKLSGHCPPHHFVKTPDVAEEEKAETITDSIPSVEQVATVDVELMDQTGNVQRSGLSSLKLVPFDHLLSKSKNS